MTATDISCNGLTNGSADLSPSGGTGAYTYSWSPGGATTQDLTGLSTGTYVVTVTDSSGCTGKDTAIITQPAVISSSVAGTNPVCIGDNNGSVNLTITGGSQNLVYSWSNAATTQDITGLIAGTYSVTAIDTTCGDTITYSVTLVDPDPFTAFGIVTNVSCNAGTNGSINLTTIGGSGSFLYSWSPVSASTQDVSGLASGTYTVQVIDTACADTIYKNFTVNQPAVLTTTFTIYPPGCGSSNGTATAVPAGGTGPFTYAWNTGATTPSVIGLTGQPTDTLIVTITDSKGCTVTDTALVSCVLGVNNSKAEVTHVSVFPNPGSGEFSLTFFARSPGDYAIEMMNDIGQTIYSEELKSFSGNYSRKMDIAHYGKGIYLLRIKGDYGITLRKVIVQ